MINRAWKDLQKKIEKILLKPRSNKTLLKFIVVTFSATILVTSYLLSIPYLSKTLSYKKGDISEEYIRVTKDINYEVKEETEKKKEEALERSPYIFIRDYNTYKKVVEIITGEFSDILSIKGNDQLYEKAVEKLPLLGDSRNISREDVLEIFNYRNQPQALLHWISEYATWVFDNFGILDQPVSQPLSEAELEKVGIRIVTPSAGKDAEFTWNSDRLIYYQDLFTVKNYTRLANNENNISKNKIYYNVRKIAILRVLQLYYQNPYTHYSSFETSKKKEETISKIKPVMATLKKGLTIVRPGDPVDGEKLMQIQLLNEHKKTLNIKNILGIFLVQMILALTLAIYIYKFSDVSMRTMASYIILLSILYQILLISFIISRIPTIQSDATSMGLFIPMIYMSVISCILLGAGNTFAAGVYLSINIFYISEYDNATLLICIISVLTGIFATLRMNRRSDFFIAALMSGIILSFTVLGINLSSNRAGESLEYPMMIAFLNAFLSIVLAIGILPLYEGIFNIPTRFRLMELSDIDNPLLKTLSASAPSSYSHSLLMASMAEKAITRINGDALLTRVGCLYHDIGKTRNPGIYAENKNLDEFKSFSPDYNPTEYASIIIQHVQDGIALAREYRLPEKVIAFIPEHHGTSVMQYFYHETLEKSANSNDSPDKKNFQYPGPRPQTKETAVVMLADSLEAASRSIQQPDRENYTQLIDTIIKNKIDDGQLDESNLTLADLSKIKESFLETMMSTFHSRPSYPSKNKTSELENSLESNNQNSVEKANINVSEAGILKGKTDENY